MSVPQIPRTLENDQRMQDVYLIAWLYDATMIGFKESRDLLELTISGFKEIRDHELDEYQTLLEQRDDENKTLEDEPPDLPDV
jgi:hypothetical protein